MRVSTLAIALLSSVLSDVASAAITPEPKCLKPAIRKEWRSLKRSEKKAFFSAIDCLHKVPHNPKLHNTGATPAVQPIDPTGSRYDDAVYVHMDAVNSAHITGIFLAWHRHYIQSFEDELRTQCGFKGTIPFWDWTLDGGNMYNASIWDADPEVGLGVFPTEATNYTLTTGAFRNYIPVYPNRHRLTRKFLRYPFSGVEFPWNFLPGSEKITVDSLMTLKEQRYMTTSFRGDYTSFQGYVDGTINGQLGIGLHFGAHIALGGDSEDIGYGPNDPTFWLLHNNIDRVWNNWQNYYPENKFAIGGGVTSPLVAADALTAAKKYPAGYAPWVTPETIIPFAGFAPDIAVKKLLDIKGGHLCYDFENTSYI